jgi:hypothetical protein
VGALFNPLGNAVGQVIPPFVVTAAAATDDDGSGSIDPSDVTSGMQVLLVGEAVALGAAFAFMACVFKSHPPSPPSRSTQDRLNKLHAARAARSLAARENGSEVRAGKLEGAYAGLAAWSTGGDGGDGGDSGADSEAPGVVLTRLGRDFGLLLQNRNFNLLLFAFTVGLAVFNALLTCLNQWLRPYGYSNDEAGLAGGVLILAGLVGAGVAAVAVDAYHCYREVLKGAFVVNQA